MAEMDQLIAKAGVLVEALPYIRTFRGKTFVIKYGGRAMEKEELKQSIALDIILLKFIGINPVVLHGGGSEVTRMMERLGKKPVFVGGLRVTDKDTMELVEMVLVGKINKELVGLINQHGGKAIGLSGKDSNLIIAQKKPPVEAKADGEESLIDLEYVGEVTRINPEAVQILAQEGYIPVISSVGVSLEGESLNINADHAAGEMAAALHAEKLILLTDVEGIFADPLDPETLISSLNKERAAELIREGHISEGMIPKVEACLEALEQEVLRTHIIDGRISHSLLLEIFTDRGIGTMVTR